MKCILILLVLEALIVLCKGDIDLTSIKEWNSLDFKFPSAQKKKEAIDKGWFVANKSFPLDVDVDYEDVRNPRMFVTIPRFSAGVPITLGTVKMDTDALIEPYPDYSWHSTHGANCDKITSVLRISIDECRRLWVMDTGKIGSVQHCPPQLLAFDLSTNDLIIRYKFPKELYSDVSLFISPLVDIKAPFNSCTKTKVYIPDVNAFALVVYDFETEKSWRIQNKLFYPNPNWGTFKIADESFDMMDGIFGIAIKKDRINHNHDHKHHNNNHRNNNHHNHDHKSIDRKINRNTDDRLMYFHSLSSNTENTVPLSVINNNSLWEQDSGAEPRAFKIIGPRSSQTSIQTIDSNGNMWFVLIEPLALACWDSSTTYNRDNIKIVLKNEETLQFASGLKLVKNASGQEELWITTIRIQKIYAGTMNFDETNFRIQMLSIDTLLRGNTRCNGETVQQKMIYPTD